MITVRPERYAQYGDSEGVDFILLTNPAYSALFHISEDNAYRFRKTVSCQTSEDFQKALSRENIKNRTHFLVLSPDVLFSSPTPEQTGGDCKILSMPCNSSEMTPEDLSYYLSVMEKTDPVRQQQWADHFFKEAEPCEYLVFRDRTFGLEARLKLRDDNWFEQLGPLSWGGQQFVPAGEISVLPMFHGEYQAQNRMGLDGEIALKGYPIVNSGKVSFLREDQNRIHAELTSLQKEPLIARVEEGRIMNLSSQTPDHPGLTMLETLFKTDSRYRIIWEIGFGCNFDMDPRPGNRSPNESFGGENGAVHWGLGLTPFTQYHIDLICPDITVSTSRGVLIAGPVGEQVTPEKSGMNRKKSAGCPCLD